jgi:hypothetical protein
MILEQLIELLEKIKKLKIIKEKPTKYHFSRKSSVKEYGEEIWGAKKHILGEKRLKESLESIEEQGDEYAISNITKKNLISKFDVQEQIENGKSAGHIYFSKYIVDSIPTKPSIPESQSYRESYYNEVQYILSVIDDTYYLNDLIFRLRERVRKSEQEIQLKYKERISSEIKPTSNYEKFKRFEIKWNEMRYYIALDHMGGKYRNALTLGKHIPISRNNPIDDRFSQANRLESGEEIRNEIDPDLLLIDYYDKKIIKDGFIILRESTEQDYINLIEVLSPKKRITTERTVADSLNERHRKLLEKYGNLQEERFPYLSESGEIAVTRLGMDFDFRGIQFGNYVSDRDRIIHTKLVYGSFYDLSQILGMELKDIGFDKRLSISIGARGSGKAKAHYEKNQKIINLTKSRGNGSIAHEYAHSLDNILFSALKEFDGNIKKTFSNQFMQYHRKYKQETQSKKRLDDILDDTVANYFSYQYKFPNLDEKESRKILIAFYNILAYIRESGFRYRSLNEGTYWGNNEELFARAFESYISDKLEENKIENFYLVFSTKGNAQLKEFSIYPQTVEREEINKLFDKLFKLMKPIWNKLW